MAKELLSRKCSHCGHNGHNSRTCSRVVKLFGVRLTATDHIGVQIRKSVSTGNLLHYRGFGTIQSELGAASEEGYLSDGLVHTSSKSRDRKKGVSWSEEEHRLFLVGLDKLGKGDWRGISRNFVTSRTPTQVASHAQKYFLRQSTLHKRKRRSSLFDMCPHAPNVTGSIMEEDSHNFSPNLGEFGLSGGLELSMGEAPNLPLCTRPEQAPEGLVSTEPQLLLPLWPELQSETRRSNANSNCKRIEPVMDDGEHSELSLSVAPPCRERESVPTHPSCCDCDLSLSRAMNCSPAMIRVV